MEPETTPEVQAEEITRDDKRITDLSKKVKDVASERDTERVSREAAEKDRDFYKDFGQTSSKYPGAQEYQEQIREKVVAGYSVEDATVAVLNREGKLVPPPAAPPPPPRPAAGGSAVTNPPDGGMKSVGEMTQAERRAGLIEAEKRGDISLS